MNDLEHYKNLTSKLWSSTQHTKKMITQLLVSVSIFSSLVFSYSSLRSSSSPLIMYSENLNYFSSKYSFQLLMNKNCVFLICNGLLVFLAKTSGRFVRSPSGYDLTDMLQKNIGDGLQIDMETESAEHPKIATVERLEEHGEAKEQEEEEEEEEEEEHIDVKEVIECSSEVPILIEEISNDEEELGGCVQFEEVVENADEMESTKCLFSYDQQQLSNGEHEQEEEVLEQHGQQEEEEEEEEEVLEQHGQEEEEKLGQGEDEEEEEEEEEDVDEMEKLSTEELNQKFEDFIRKMKEEFRINNDLARRQQIVMVN